PPSVVPRRLAPRAASSRRGEDSPTDSSKGFFSQRSVTQSAGAEVDARLAKLASTVLIVARAALSALDAELAKAAVSRLIRLAVKARSLAVRRVVNEVAMRSTSVRSRSATTSFAAEVLMPAGSAVALSPVATPAVVVRRVP